MDKSVYQKIQWDSRTVKRTQKIQDVTKTMLMHTQWTKETNWCEFLDLKGRESELCVVLIDFGERYEVRFVYGMCIKHELYNYFQMPKWFVLNVCVTCPNYEPSQCTRNSDNSDTGFRHLFM